MRTLALIGLAGLALAATAALRAGEAPAEARDGFVVHEWGVFTVPRNAAWANLDMKAEWASMPREFYGRLPGRNLPYRGPVTKPVIYFHAEKPVKLSLTVRFPEGLPVVWWPAAQTPNSEIPPDSKERNLLDFRAELVERAPEGLHGPASDVPRKLSVPEGHWIEKLRQVKAADVFCAGGHGRGGTSWDTEKFIYYDGLMKPPAAPRADRQGDCIVLDVPAGEIWQDVMVIERDGKGVRAAAGWEGWEAAPAEGAGRHVRVEMKPADEDRLQALRKELVARLTAAGLNADEAAALVEVWKEGLFEQDGLTVFYRVPQSTYDRWLPLEIKPAPEKTVRVGLVLHRRLEPELEANVGKLIGQLGSKEFEEREEARKQLMKIGGAAFPLLEQHVQDKDPEVAVSCRSILEALDARPVLK